MATMTFYEKPGCVNNTRQTALLEAAGHRVPARNLLTELSTEEELRPYFDGLPIPRWLNPGAPHIKSGEMRPETLDEAGALARMVADPLLNRRPRCGWVTSAEWPSMRRFREPGRSNPAPGSFGWSGEAVRMIEDRLRGLKLRVPVPGLRVKLIPTAEELEECRSFGRALADTLVGNQAHRVVDMGELA